MARKSEQTPKDIMLMPAPPVRKLIAISDEQATALIQAQAAVNELQGRLDALLVGILTGHAITSGRVLRLTDEHPRRLEVEVSPNGNGKG